jgi:elongation factor Ts
VEISAALVKQLRDRTNAGVMECKRALTEAKGDLKAAENLLAEWGLNRADKKSGRETNQGLVDTYIHGGGRIGAMVELNCETDFVARNDMFRQLAHDIAMQVAAMNPKYVSAEEVTADDVGRPEELALLEQAFIKDPKQKIGDLIKEAIVKTGENVQLRRFVRFELGG